MEDNINLQITSEDLRKAFEGEEPVKSKSKKFSPNKINLVCLVSGIIGIVGGMTLLVVALVLPSANNSIDGQSDSLVAAQDEYIYSDLTGEELSDASLKTAPAYCVQTPNGTDGARPQAGLNEAGVIFEAIAESGITRFAAIYQNPEPTIIGPVRSLRIYYLEWDTPFDCTIVHAGGSGDALAAVSRGYKDLSEDYQYMHRGTYGSRRWNNLFTNTEKLQQFSTEHNYNTSEIKGFARMTPDESAKARVESSIEEPLVITQPTDKDTSAVSEENGVTKIGLKFGGFASFNVDYNYDADSNTYLRSYANGDPHEVYDCTADSLNSVNPEDACILKQMAPSVVVAMVVPEHIASDNYHEDISTTGSGEAYIFQNGGVIRGAWHKATVNDQIKFTDEKGSEVRLAPGQTIVSAIPGYGSVDF